ncbi:MAG: hypothetical protein ACI4MM_06505 [Candidatus Ventricola sp.]
MKRFVRILALALLMVAMTASAQASQKLNIYIDKDAILAHDVSAADIRIRPEGMVHVTRHSLWPWDEEGSKWSMFVEMENISAERIVIDEDWLIACKANRDEIATADYVFECTTNRFGPGEKIVLYAGAYPYALAKHANADAKLDTWDVEGLSDFANRIRQAKILRVRLDTRGAGANQNWLAVAIAPKVWAEGRTLRFEWMNDTDEPVEFRTVGAVMSDAQGRIMDVIRTTLSRTGTIAPGETLTFEKELAPYITQDMLDGAVFAPYAYRFPPISGDAD